MSPAAAALHEPRTGRLVLRRCGATHHGHPAAPPIVGRVLESGGVPLDGVLRAHLEPRFGHDFSRIRVHAGDTAAASAEAVGARAYTVGDHIAFAAGEYRPATPEGRRLVAHELTHAIQDGAPLAAGAAPEVGAVDDPAERQAEAVAAGMDRADGPVPDLPHSATAALRRACPPAPTNIAAQPMTPFPCVPAGGALVRGDIVRYCRDSTELADGQSMWVDDIVDRARHATAIEIHGNASPEGPSAAYNVTLSCMRAAAFRDILTSRGVTAPSGLMAHGPTAAYGPADANRNIVVTMTLRRCGPDATDWLLRQVAAAKRDRDVLAVRSKLLEADRLLARWGLSAVRIAEGAVLEKVLEAESRAGRPVRTPEAIAQIRAAAPGAAEFSRAKNLAVALGLASLASPLASPDEAATLVLALLLIRNAAQEWAALVGTRRRYDFKWDTGTMRGPTSANCPADCAHTITLCPASASDCFRTDVPGNIFYAHVGRFVGFSELILQLGSEFAQLASRTRSWDPPEDTQLIAASFGLPDPLTHAGLCGKLAASRSLFDLSTCLNCPEQTRAVIR
jgi:outer membrane protein OmpA-like peptidoglycan-associated protein